MDEDGLVLQAGRAFVQQGRLEMRWWYDIDFRLEPTKSDLSPFVDEVELCNLLGILLDTPVRH